MVKQYMEHMRKRKPHYRRIVEQMQDMNLVETKQFLLLQSRMRHSIAPLKNTEMKIIDC